MRAPQKMLLARKKRRWRALILPLLPAPAIAGMLPAGLLAWGMLREAPVRFDTGLARATTLGAAEALVPSAGLPSDLVLGAANNNLDAVEHDGRSFLAFRTATTHFADDSAALVILSSADRKQWTLEARIDLDRRDLREPRFLSFHGKLFFYFFEAADDPMGFAPIAMRASVRSADGHWSESVPIFEPGHVPWRARVHGDRAYLCAYDGRRLYDDLGIAGGPRLLVSDDGMDWRSLSGARSPVSFSGASECDFDFDHQGGLVALVRVEARGALVCTAPPERLDAWDCSPTPLRHDSPLLLRRGDDFYAIARRNVDGPLDDPIGWAPGGKLWPLLRYWVTRKRTTLYRILPAEHITVPVLDLQSRGDTAFAGAVPLADGRYWIANYSSPLDGGDWPWVIGQLRETRIYAQELTLPPASVSVVR